MRCDEDEERSVETGKKFNEPIYRLIDTGGVKQEWLLQRES